MAITLATGTQIAVGSTFGTVFPFSAASNAAECVLSFASDPALLANDIVHITNSGWPLLNGVVAVVKEASGTGPYLVTLKGVDTQDTILYPAGEGAGSAKEVTAWATLSLVQNAEISGGTVNRVPVPLLANPITGTLPGEKEGVVVSCPVYFEATPDAGIVAAMAAERLAVPCAFRMTHPAGDKTYTSAYWSVIRTAGRARAEPRLSRVEAAWLPVPESIYAS